ncbi:protein PAT1 homolog 1-like isoform X2 [Physella acuta]|uniref:protein PAT1 homolog 1-like isoform X2 n=1 Tax=Physella acuta TaxID=109671 RepID=UPI0027DB0267|nr:protein PAT1 homolog 1-like isoform X2 [Physella acuta]
MALSRDDKRMFSALGVGKLASDENELSQAPEEEEDFDVLNEETFGDLGDGDFDWEEHTRMAEELEGSLFPSHEDQTKDSGFITMDRGYSTATQEDELEQSISRLVVDDGDSKCFTANGQPIPGTSPGKNIWGSPSGDNLFQKPVNNTLQALFASAKQAAYRDFPGVFHDARCPPVPSAALPLPAEAQTLAEIEHNMLAREQHKPRVLTSEELERQLRGEPPFALDQKAQYTLPAHIPPVGTSVAFRKQPTQAPPLMGHLGPKVSNGESSPINIIRPHTRTIPGFHESPILMGRSLSPSPSSSHFMPGIPPQSGLLAQSPSVMPPYSPMFMANLFGNAMSRPPPPAPPHITNIGSPFGSPSAVIAQRQPLAHMPYQQRTGPWEHGQLDARTGQHYGERRDHYNVTRGPGQHAHFQRPQHPTGDYGYREVEDEYAGLMTKKEKDWIIKIQLIQLQTDNPYLDDYYYTYYTMKKKAADREKNQDVTGDKSNNELELLIPNMVKLEPRTYTPAQFEGSLGRLTAASVHNPRQIIDVCRNASPTNENSTQKSVSKELRKYRQLLMDIEKGFNIILDVDDIEKKVLALPSENRLPLFEERLEKIQAVYDYFMQDDSLKNFLPTLGVRKGRKLLARLMPLLDKVQWLSIVTVFLSHLPILIKKDQDEEGLQVLMPPLSRYLSQCDLECLVHFATILQKHPKQNEEGLLLLLHNSFGISLLCCLIKAGEDYFKNTSPIDIDNQLKTQWTQFIEEFVVSLETVPTEELAWPDMHQPQVGEHVDRFINNKLIGSVEDKLAHFSKPRPKHMLHQEVKVES